MTTIPNVLSPLIPLIPPSTPRTTQLRADQRSLQGHFEALTAAMAVAQAAHAMEDVHRLALVRQSVTYWLAWTTGQIANAPVAPVAPATPEAAA